MAERSKVKITVLKITDSKQIFGDKPPMGQAMEACSRFKIGQEFIVEEEGLLEYYDLFCDPLFNDEIPRFWDAWKSTKDMIFVSKIVRHNYCCLAKEYYLKLKRIDKLSLNKIIRLQSSALIEKVSIRAQLGLSME